MKLTRARAAPTPALYGTGNAGVARADPGVKYWKPMRSVNNRTQKSTLIKRDIAVLISDQTGLLQQEVLRIIQLLTDNIAGHLAQNKTVTLRNFGTFERRVSKPRVGRNPRNRGENLVIPPRGEVKFVPGKELKERVARICCD